MIVMQSQGVHVMVEALDVTDAARLTYLVQRLSATMPPLRGVIHGAMVLDDGLLAGLTADRLRQRHGTENSWGHNLDYGDREMPLDFFVMLSSVASLLGNVGQANYAAANAFLDAFAAVSACAGPARHHDQPGRPGRGRSPGPAGAGGTDPGKRWRALRCLWIMCSMRWGRYYT